MRVCSLFGYGFDFLCAHGRHGLLRFFVLLCYDGACWDFPLGLAYCFAVSMNIQKHAPHMP